MRQRQTALLCMGLLLATGAAFGQSFSGSVASRMGWWCQSGNFDPRSQYVTGKISGKVGDQENPSAQYQAELRVGYDPAAGGTSVDMRETWIKAFLGPMDLSVGKQLVSWGTTDVFTPVDVVNPRDFTLPPESLDEKIPLTMLRSVINGDGLVVDLVAVPFFTESIAPGSRWRSAVSLPSGVVPTVTLEKPGDRTGNMQFGGRLQKSFDIAQGADLAFSVFDGRETTATADVRVTPGTPPAVEIDERYRRFLMTGFDGAFAFVDGILLKSEMSYTTYDGTSPLKPDTDCASTEGLIGWEYTILEGVKTIGEYDAVWDNDGGNGSWTRTALLILSGDIGSRFSYKLTGGYNLDGSEFLAPLIAYTLADGLVFETKAYAFWGETSTKYGQWRDNDVIEMSVKYSF
jgi:hypothetical protein